MQVYAGQANLKCERGSYLRDAYRLTAPRTAKDSKGRGKKPKRNDDGEAKATAGESADGDQEAQTQADDKPEDKPASTPPEDATATTASKSTCAASTGEKPATQAQDEQATAHGASSGTSARSTEADRPDDADTSAKSGAGTTQPTAPKLTIKQVIELAVGIAGKKPALVPAMIEREAEAANLSVIIPDADPRRACDELARILQDRIGDVASNDYQDACYILTSIVESLWESVNAHAPAEDAEPVDDDSDDCSEDDTAEEEEQPKRRKARGPMG